MKIRQYIESAMMELIAEKPIDKIFVSDVIKKVGVCRRTFYKYYLDKYDLLTQCFQKNFYCKLTGTGDLRSFLEKYAEEVVRDRKRVFNAFRSDDVNSLLNYNSAFFADVLYRSCFYGMDRGRQFAEAYGDMITRLTLRFFGVGRRQGEPRDFADFILEMIAQYLKSPLERCG